MKMLSFATLAFLLSVSACSHHSKSCCAKKDAKTCTKESCQKPCCDKEKKCADGSCVKEQKKECCKGDSCEKKKS